MKKVITVIPGDGIGPEVVGETVKILQAVAKKFKHDFQFNYCLMGACAIEDTGDPLPAETVEKCLQGDAVLLGAIGDPKYDNDPSAKVRPEQGLLRLRKELQLFANLRPVASYKSLTHLSPLKEARLKGVDFVIYRELTGGIYFGNKETNQEGTEAFDVCSYQKYEIERIAHLAFKHAQKRKKKLTLVDKANVLETSRLWRKTVKKIAENYPDVKVDFMFVDNAAMQLIVNPAHFDILLTENMFGDILSDEASVISGSLGLLPSSSVGEKTVLFEPIHGSYPQAAGKDIANPIGTILSAALMLEHFELYTEAGLVREAVDWTLQHGFVTKDIDDVNAYSTTAVGELIRDFILNDMSVQYNFNNIMLGKATII